MSDDLGATGRRQRLPVSLSGDAVPIDIEDRAIRCAEWTHSAAVRPGGSAGTYQTIILVETPPPWPNDISEIPTLAEAVGLCSATRVLAVVPRRAITDILTIVCWQRNGTTGYTGVDYAVRPTRVAEFLRRLVSEPSAPQPEAVGPSPRDVLLCAHGRRDRCCGRLGTLLASDAASRWPDTRVWRCSHTGGHRFAPTGFTFPEGRGWAGLDVPVLDQIMRTDDDEWSSLAFHHRGFVGFDSWAQVAEDALLQRLGRSWGSTADRTATTAIGDGGRTAVVTFSWSDDLGPRTADVTVVTSRDVPVPVCGAPIAASKKTSPEYGVESVVLAPRG